MNELALVESHSLRQEFCTDGNTAILERVGQLVLWEKTGWSTKENVALFYQVDINAIDQLVFRHKDELIEDGYKIISKKELENLQSVSFKIPNRGLAIFPRRAILRIGMLLRDSEVAKKVRAYLLNVEQAVSSIAQGTMDEMLEQLTNQAVQLQKNADQLVSQSKMIAAIFNKVGENERNLDHMQLKVDSHDKRIDALEQITSSRKPEEEYVSQEQVAILRTRVKALGNPDRVWAKFRTHFEITRYKFLPRSRFREALDWLENYGENGLP